MCEKKMEIEVRVWDYYDDFRSCSWSMEGREHLTREHSSLPSLPPQLCIAKLPNVQSLQGFLTPVLWTIHVSQGVWICSSLPAGGFVCEEGEPFITWTATNFRERGRERGIFPSLACWMHCICQNWSCSLDLLGRKIWFVVNECEWVRLRMLNAIDYQQNGKRQRCRVHWHTTSETMVVVVKE